ncbi:hypothetical protein RAA17_21950 [Komagataeibacter rhaeticus]|nr:hypothetical protein [Komagataeibacter rhaeticus]
MPEDVSVVGFDDTAPGRPARPVTGMTDFNKPHHPENGHPDWRPLPLLSVSIKKFPQGRSEILVFMTPPRQLDKGETLE